MRENHKRFGYTKEQWESSKRESREIMVEIARQRGMITYGDLAKRLTTISVEPHDMVLWYIIGDVARDEDAGKRGMLSVVVVHKYGDMEPGVGFYELAKELGRNTRDKVECFIEELHKVHSVWSVNR